MSGTRGTLKSSWIFYLFIFIAAINNASVTRAQSNPVDCSSYVTVTFANDRSTLDTKTRMTTSTADVTITNQVASGKTLSTPLQAVISINNANGTVTMPDASGGPGTSPYGKYYYDLSSKLKNGKLLPGASVTFGVKFVRASTVRFTYSISTYAVLPAANQSPIANAGPDQTITLSIGQTSTIVQLDGSASYDPDGTVVGYSWSGNPQPSNIQKPSVTLSAGKYVFTLIVTDNNGATSQPSMVTITVNPAPNQPPIANAGSNQTFTLPVGQTSISVQLDGSASTDPDGTIAAYAWSGTPKPANVMKPTVTLSAGTYTFTLVVTDNSGVTSQPSTVTITVNPAPNQPPVANAGSKQTLTLSVGQTSMNVQLDGSASTDPDGIITAYAWSGTPKPANVMKPTVTLSAGTYTFTLVVTDNNGATSQPSTVTITVNPAPNQPPVANAGSNQTLTLPVGQTSMSVQLDGSASTDPDGTIAAYAWSGTPKPADVAKPTVNLTAGTYTFTLVVTDNSGATSQPSTVSVTVNASQNQVPIADAGSNKTYTLPYNQTGMSVTLDGSGSHDPDGSITAYTWGGTPKPNNVVQPAVTLGEGVYTFSLVVTDSSNAQSTQKTVTITVVKEVVHQPQISISSPPYTIPAGSNTPLNINVSATSPDARSVTLSASPQLSNAAFPATSGVTAQGTFAFTPQLNQAGLYVVTFTARDTYGITNSVTAQITVTATNKPPVLTLQDTATVVEGAVLKIPVTAANPDGDILTLTATGLPTNAVFIPALGTISFSPVIGQAAGSPYLATVSASDGQATVSKTISITVTAASGGGQTGPLTLTVDPVESPTFLSTRRITGTVNGAGQTQIGQKSALITGMSPTTGKQGDTLSVSLTGDAVNYVTHFINGGSTASFGSGITVQSLTVTGPTQATAAISIDPSATVGTRSVSVTTGSETAVSINAFNVVKGQTTITGSLVDPGTSLPIAGATVVVEGTTVSAITDANGYFTLQNVPSGSQTLMVNAANHEALTVNINAQTNTAINVDVLKPASTVFDASSSSSTSVMSVIGRGAIELSAANKDAADVRKLVVDSILMTGGKSAGVLDEFGNQLNPNISGNGTISLKASGADLIVERWQRGDTMTLGDFLIGFPLLLEWPSMPTPLRGLSALQSVVNQAWDQPNDPNSALMIALFNRGNTVLPTAPKLSLETPLNALQAYMMASTLFAWANNDMSDSDAAVPVLSGESAMRELRKEILLAYNDTVVIGDSMMDGGKPVFYAQATTTKPIAYAGPNQTITLNNQVKNTKVTVTLDGSGSYVKDQSATIVRYQWRPFTTTDPTPADGITATVTFTAGAHHTYRLWVTDSNDAQSDPSDVTIDITGDCNFTTASDQSTYPWCSTFTKFLSGQAVKKVDLVSKYVGDIVATVNACKVVQPMMNGKPTYMQAMTDGVIGFFEGKNSDLVMKLNNMAMTDKNGQNSLKDIYQEATAGAKQMGQLASFAKFSANIVKGQLDSFVGSVANSMFDFMFNKFVSAIIDSTRPPAPFIKSAEILQPDSSTGQITQQVKLTFTPCADELSDIKKAVAGNINGVRKYSYLIYRLSTGNGQGLQRLTIIPGSNLPYKKDDPNSSQITGGDYVWYDTDPPYGSNVYYVVARIIRTNQVPNSPNTYDQRLILDYMMNLVPGGSTMSGVLWKTLDATDSILRGMFRQDSDFSDPARIYVGAPTQNTHPTLDLAVDKVSGTTYLSIPDTSGIFTVQPTGIQLFANAGFAKPFQRGLAVDEHSNVYSENKASDDKFGGRIFSYAPADGARNFVGSTNYYSLDLLYANAADVTALTYGIDKDGECLYIADAMNQSIKRLSLFSANPPNHNVGQPYASSSLFFFQPETKMTSDYFGNLFITQGPDLLQVSRVSGGGTYVSSVFPTNNSPFSWLSGIDFDLIGNAYVADFQAGTITMIPGGTDTLSGQDDSYRKRFVVMTGLTYPIDMKITDNGRGFITVDAEGIHKKYFGISGRIWDTANNMPLGGASLIADNALQPGKTDADGFFSLPDISTPQGPQNVKLKVVATDGRTQVIPNIALNSFGHTPLLSDLVFDPPEMPTLPPVPSDNSGLTIDPDPLPLETLAKYVGTADLGQTNVQHFIAPDRRIYSSTDMNLPVLPPGSTTGTINFTPNPPDQPATKATAITPFVTIISPSDQLTTTARSVTVIGMVVPSQSIDSVILSVNGQDQDLTLSNGQFSATIALRDGVNVISARVVDPASNANYLRSAPIQVQKGASLSPSMDFSGVVFKADSETSRKPYADMTVTLYGSFDGGTTFRIIDSVTSGTDGLYRFHLANTSTASAVVRAVFDQLGKGNTVPMKIVISDPRS